MHGDSLAAKWKRAKHMQCAQQHSIVYVMLLYHKWHADIPAWKLAVILAVIQKTEIAAWSCMSVPFAACNSRVAVIINISSWPPLCAWQSRQDMVELWPPSTVHTAHRDQRTLNPKQHYILLMITGKQWWVDTRNGTQEGPITVKNNSGLNYNIELQ